MLQFDWGTVFYFRSAISLLHLSKLRVDVISVVFDARATMSVGLRDFNCMFTGSVHFVFADSSLSLGWLGETLDSVCSQLGNWVVRWSCVFARVCL